MTFDFRDRPSMLDQNGGRLPLYPAEARGIWRSRRTWVQGLLMFLFLGLPWISINGAPALFVDLSGHRLFFFGLKLWAHDGPLLFLFLAIFAVGLALATTLFGRAWCGWACPQTVFLDGVIRRIERWTEGSHLQRRALDAAPWDLSKLRKKITKWTLFAVFSAILTHTFLAYFFGTTKVLEMMATDPHENPKVFFFMLGANALMLFDLAWFREQFCLIVCPYGRIQSVLMDQQTITVQYDKTRGEPRKLKGMVDHGACISCNRCISVCPTGIDIRNGGQLECIACTACIDACDDVMKKTNQPLGLIRHRALKDPPLQFFRARVLLYLGAFLLLVVSLGVSLQGHRTLGVTVLRALGTPYFTQKNSVGATFVVNSFRLHLHNQSEQDLKIELSLEPSTLPDAVLRAPDASELLRVNDSRMIPFAVEIPKESLKGKDVTPIKIRVQNETYEVEFVSPRF